MRKKNVQTSRGHLRNYCSSLARESDEPLIGSAIFANQYVFVSWPKVYWAAAQYQSKHFPGDVVDTLVKIQRVHNVLGRLVAKDNRDIDVCDVIFMPQSIIYRDVEISQVSPLIHNQVSGFPTGRTPEALVGPQIFCCTHGIRDRCCAKFGFALLRNMKAEGDVCGAKVGLWETTHLGGDRFTATTITFPSGQMHGHLRPVDARELLRSAVETRPIPYLYRGNVFLSGPSQLAEAFAHLYAYQREQESPASTSIVGSEGTETNSSVRIELRDGNGDGFDVLQIDCHRRQFEVTIDCSALEQNIRKTVTRWAVYSCMSVYE